MTYGESNGHRSHNHWPRWRHVILKGRNRLKTQRLEILCCKAVYSRGSANLATAWLLVHYVKAGVFLAVAVWGGQRGGHICIEGEGVIWHQLNDSYAMPRCDYTAINVTLIGYRGHSSRSSGCPLAAPWTATARKCIQNILSEHWSSKLRFYRATH